MPDTATRGKVKPGKKQVNWRIGEQVYNRIVVIAGEQGFSSVPLCVDFILYRVSQDANARKSVFSGSKY